MVSARGRDVLAAFNSSFGKFLALVECKRYSPENLVGLNIVERFLWTIEEQDRATFGLVATTSSFASGAKMVAKQNEWTLELQDFSQITNGYRATDSGNI